MMLPGALFLYHQACLSLWRVVLKLTWLFMRDKSWSTSPKTFMLPNSMAVAHSWFIYSTGQLITLPFLKHFLHLERDKLSQCIPGSESPCTRKRLSPANWNRQLVTLPLGHHFFQLLLPFCSALRLSPKKVPPPSLNLLPYDLIYIHDFKYRFCFSF